MLSLIKKVTREIARANRNEKINHICALPAGSTGFCEALTTKIGGEDLISRLTFLAFKSPTPLLSSFHGFHYRDAAQGLQVVACHTLGYAAPTENICVLWKGEPVMAARCVQHRGLEYEDSAMFVYGFVKPRAPWIEAVVSVSDRHNVEPLTMTAVHLACDKTFYSISYFEDTRVLEKIEDGLGRNKIQNVRPAATRYGKVLDTRLAS